MDFNHRILEHEEIVELIAKMHQGCEKSRETMILCNIKLVK